MKTCEEYVLKQLLEQESVIAERSKLIEELTKEIEKLKNPISEVLDEGKKVDCITLYKSANVIYQLNTNTYLYQYKEAFESIYANGKITLDEMKKALEDNEELEKINNRFVINRWSSSERMYQFEPATHDMFEFNIGNVQYVIWGNYENMFLSKLNDFEHTDGFFYEKYKEQCLEKAREEVRKTLKDTIEYLEKKDQSNES